MKTITFYSYKGGVGRSLLVANAAKYLSSLSCRVFALDLDLEAPGLHYKFELGQDSPRSEATIGIVDILAKFVNEHEMPDALAPYTTQLKVTDGAGDIYLMRAGTAPHGNYWRLLSQVSWYDLFYGRNPVGAPFFLELKERIRQEFNPDFVLIDARTGITEMGSIATTLLPDTVVCLGLASFEHLEGLRAIMQGIKRTTSQDGAPVMLVPVVSRLPVRSDTDEELAGVLAVLNNSDGASSLNLQADEIVALHSEPLLDSAEQLLVGGKKGPHELPLLRDYLRLFSKIIPAEVVRPYVGQLIQHATSRLLDDPDTAQSELEALTAYCADQDAYRALLKVYLLRKAPIDKLITTAATMWHLGGSDSRLDQFLLDIVKVGFAEARAPEIQKRYADFAEAVWRASEEKDIRIGMTVANAYLPERREKAVQLLSDYIDTTDEPSLTAVTRLIELQRANPKAAMSIVERFKGAIQPSDFYIAWLRLVLDQKNPILAQELIEDPSFRPGSVRTTSPTAFYRLLKLTGSREASAFLEEAVEKAAATEEYGQVANLGEIFDEEGRLDEFESLLQATHLPSQIASDILMRIRRPSRNYRYAGRPSRLG
jgi:hypothetical protein